MDKERRSNLDQIDQIWRAIEDLKGLSAMLLIMSETTDPEMLLFLVHTLDELAQLLERAANKLDKT